MTTQPALNVDTSVIDFLKSSGQASDLTSRATLASGYGIKDYAGTEEQNNQLLQFLKNPAPVSTAAPAAAPAPVATPAAPAGAPAPAAPNAPAPAAPVVPPAAAPAPVATPAAPAGAPAPAALETLQYGSRGPAVSAIQSLLGVPTTGNFLSQTRAAVKAFQAANGLTVDGILDAKTTEAIQRVKGSGQSPAATVASGANSTTQPDTTKPKIETGNATIDALINRLNNQSPQKSFSDIYKEVYTSLGLTDMKTSYEDQTKQFNDLQEKKNADKEEINNNPWYSEGVRVNKLRQLDSKYLGEETVLTNKLKLLESNISNARSDAQFVSGKIMDQLDQTQKLNDDIILKAIDVAEKEAQAESSLKTVSAGSTVINSKTGEPVYTAPPKPTSAKTSATQVKTEAVSHGSSKLETARGADGFVDPYVYKEAYDGWVNGYVDSSGQKHGPIGTAAEFASKFPPAKYVNPAASSISNLLPTFLQNNKKATSASGRGT